MADPRYLEGFSPPPTGTTHTAIIYRDEWEEARALIFEMDQLQRWGDEPGVAALRDTLMSKPWWPRGWEPGDHLNIRLTSRSQVLVALGLAQ